MANIKHRGGQHSLYYLCFQSSFCLCCQSLSLFLLRCLCFFPPIYPIPFSCISFHLPFVSLLISPLSPYLTPSFKMLFDTPECRRASLFTPCSLSLPLPVPLSTNLPLLSTPPRLFPALHLCASGHFQTHPSPLHSPSHYLSLSLPHPLALPLRPLHYTCVPMAALLLLNSLYPFGMLNSSFPSHSPSLPHSHCHRSSENFFRFCLSHIR